MVHRLALMLVLLAVSSTAVHAQLFRAFLSINGSDSNPCTLPAPCRLMPAALNAVASGGEIWMLDSANFNTTTVNITKSVSIVSVPGVQGSLVAPALSPAVQVSTAGLVVALRNVFVVPNATLNTSGIGEAGFILSAASRVTIDRCTFAGLRDDAIRATAGQLSIVDSMIRDSGFDSAGRGLRVDSTANVQVDITGSRFVNNFVSALRIAPTAGTAIVTISDSAISGTSTQSGFGIQVNVSTTGATGIVHVHRTKFTNYSQGVTVSASSGGVAQGSVSGSFFTNLLFGLGATGTGVLTSFGDNHFGSVTTPVTATTPGSFL